MNKQEASKVIAEKLARAEALINECEKIADEAGVGFDLSIAYGMGGWYNPDTSDAREKFREELIKKFISEGMTREAAILHIENEELIEKEFG